MNDCYPIFILEMRKKVPSSTKRAAKFLAICKDHRINRTILQRSPDRLIKNICNAALNVERGEIPLTNKQKRILAKYRRPISKLTSKNYSIGAKRRTLVQKGGFLPAVLPIILSTVLGALGSAIFQ